MKKIFFAVLLGLVVVTGFQKFPIVRADNTPVIDQAQDKVSNGYWKILTHHWVGQTFTPKLNHLSAIYLITSDITKGNAATLSLYDSVTGKQIAQSTGTMPWGGGWTEFDFQNILIEHVGSPYTIYLDTASTTAWWGVATSGNKYPAGYAIVDNKESADQDFSFATYGYDAVSADVSGGTAVVPATPPVAVVSTPTEQTATPKGDEVQVPAIDVAASTPTATTAASDTNDDYSVLGTKIKKDYVNWGAIGLLALLVIILSWKLMANRKKPIAPVPNQEIK